MFFSCLWQPGELKKGGIFSFRRGKLWVKRRPGKRPGNAQQALLIEKCRPCAGRITVKM
jgi:hypothetical protein